VDFNWLWSKARVTQREIADNPNATVRKHAVASFLKKYNVRMRAHQRCRKTGKRNFEPDLKKWHTTIREKLVCTGRNDRYDEKWGRHQPKQHLNVEQNALPFVVGTTRTYDHVDKDVDLHDHKVWISQPGSGLDRCQCALQICFRPTEEQPRLGVISCGTGKRISQDEKEAYHPDVDVYYQENAWADTKLSVEWVQKTLLPSVKDDECFVLFCDNLTAQVSDEFKKPVSKPNVVVWYGLPNATDLWQPVDDARYAQILKTLICQAQRRWLDDDDNTSHIG